MKIVSQIIMNKIFPCGCSFDENFTPTIENIPLNCPATFDLLKANNSIGVFQLESFLGISSLKKIQPETLDEISDVISLMRPGPLEGEIDGKTIYNHYIDRKFNKEETIQPIKELEPILRSTYQLLVFQEQAIKIATEIAGFSLEEADTKIRKSLGKKRPDIIAKVKNEFIKRAEELKKVTKKEAEDIFNWIEKGQRYLFNRSHSISYATLSYLTAYIKAHFPIEFFCSSLNHTKDHEEIRRLIYDAYLNDVQVYPPNLFKLNSDFIIDNDIICYGLRHIKGLGESCVRDLIEINKATSLQNFNWLELLFKVLLKINKTCAKALLMTGAVHVGLTREKQLYDYDHATKLTKKEIEYIEQNIQLEKFDNLIDLLIYLIELGAGKGKPLANKNRITHLQGLIHSLENPAYSMDDNVVKMMHYEEALLGLPFLGPSHIQHVPDACTCLDIKKGNVSQKIIVTAVVSYLKEYENERGKIGYLAICDETFDLRGCKLYTKAWNEHKDKIRLDHAYIFSGYRDKGESFIIQSVEIL